MMNFTRRVLAAVSALLLATSVQGFSLPFSKSNQKHDVTIDIPSIGAHIAKNCAQGLLVGCLAFPQIAAAVSGGGLDYANIDITGQDFSNGNYKGKDFTQVRPHIHRVL